MAERVQVIVDAKDNASGVLRGITQNMGALGAMTEQMTGSSINWGNVAQQAYRIVSEAVKEAFDVSTKYAASVRDLALASGTTAEQSSRLIQVLDDYEITAENITAATKKMTSQGYAPTIQTIAMLSDQYLELNTAQERNQFIQENLGRGGAKWANVLKEGSDAILQMNLAVDENLILNDEQIAQYEEMRLNQDAMSDSWMALQVQFTNSAVPLLNGLMNELNDNMVESGAAVGVLRFGFDDLYRAVASTKKPIEEVEKAADISAATFWEQSYAVKASAQSAEIASKNYSGLLSLTQKLNNATREQINQSAYQNLQEKFKESGGEITQEEAEALNQAGIRLGIFDQNAVDAAASVEELSQAMADGTINIYEYSAALNAIPTNISTVATFTAGNYGSDFIGPAFTSGGTADGGFVSGPGDGTRDTFLQPMANGEFVVNARDAKRNAALLQSINGGGDAGGAGATNYFYGNTTFMLGGDGSGFMEQR